MTGAVHFGPPPFVCLKTHTSGGCSFVWVKKMLVVFGSYKQ